MNVIEGTGAIVVEPDWESLFSDVRARHYSKRANKTKNDRRGEGFRR